PDPEGLPLFKHYSYNPDDPASIGSMRITSFCEDQEHRLWIGTLGGGLNRFDPEGRSFTRFQYDPEDAASLSSNDITSIELMSDGSLWIATVSNGLNRFDPESESFTRYYNDPADQGSIASDNVYCVFVDQGGVLWVGAGGLNIFNPGLLRFAPTGTIAALKQELEGHPVYAIYEDRNGFLWAGTLANGVARLHKESGEVSWYRHQPGNSNSISNNGVSAIVEDPGGMIWISTNGGGLNRLDPVTGQWKHFRERKNTPETIGLDNLSGIVADDEGMIWMATSEEGVICYDPETDLYRQFRNDPKDPASLSGNYLLRIFMDSRGDIWIGVWGAGLNRFDGNSEQFIRYMNDEADPRSIPGNIVHSIFEQNLDTARVIWVGTANGMASFDPDQAENGFSRSPVNAQLPSRSIYGMLTDRNGKQWISTNAGISMYNPQDSSFKYYTHRDGLPGNEFNAGAFTELRQGMFTFGGAGGLLVFHPDSVHESSFEPPVALTSFSVLNEQLYDGFTLNAMEQIVLSHKQNFFSFDFASMDFSDPRKNRFMYMMEGIDEEWILSGDRNFASYTKIDPGSYLFRVRGTNSDGRWSGQEVSLRMEITPPVWQRWWFRSIVIAMGLMLIYAIHLYRIRRVREIERLRTRIASDLHDDVGSALTRISVHSQQILARKDPDRIVQSTEKINELSRDTISTMSDIVWSIDARNDTLADFLGRMQDLTHNMLSEGDISVSFRQKGMDSKRPMRVEVRQNLYYIFKEAIHNIARHSGADSVEISLDNSVATFRMLISDNGSGFDPESVKGGNGLKNMKMRAARIRATLELFSTGGCVIELKMKGL
ncbi:MAG: two-component regulator propeller domain-containing protein, partial [Bacteroidota bacterium]|nr:two-component regulator propeller domain-containing protein [Bacteroidota bacterium]